MLEVNMKKGHVKFILALILNHPSFTPVVSLGTQLFLNSSALIGLPGAD